MNLRSNVTATPALRLVGGRTLMDAAGPRESDRSAMRQVARENRAASLRHDLDPADPRWILASRTRSELQGAALTADRRARLLGLAYQLGMRPFDANMVIAIVQDEARLALSGADSTWELADRLRIIPDGLAAQKSARGADSACEGATTRTTPVGLMLAVSAMLGAAGLIVLLRWLMA